MVVAKEYLVIMIECRLILLLFSNSRFTNNNLLIWIKIMIIVTIISTSCTIVLLVVRLLHRKPLHFIALKPHTTIKRLDFDV